MKRIFILLSAAVVLASCGSASKTTRGMEYPQMYEEKPVTILVMPPINNSSNVEAKELLYTSISRPLAEAGYYVISPRLAMDILKAESAYDAELFFEADLKPFKKVFGVDAVVFSVIDSWTKKGFGISTKIRYVIKSAHTGEVLFDRDCDLYLDLSDNSTFSGGGIVGSLLNLALSAVNTALTETIVAAREANYFIFEDIPRGKYSPDCGNDSEVRAKERNIKVTVK